MPPPTNSGACSVTPPASWSAGTGKSSGASPASSATRKSPGPSNRNSDRLVTMLDEKEFQRKADAAFEDLKRRLLVVGDEHDFDVEGESGKLEVIFEEPEEAKFVVSPNTPVREIWISALSTSFKLGWSESKNAFVSEKTGDNLFEVMSRVVSQQLGTQVKV